ncbi:LNR domain protein [Pelomyxa schiedti]|nr:LNR domain protein [Pelomyxa schiedti]
MVVTGGRGCRRVRAVSVFRQPLVLLVAVVFAAIIRTAQCGTGWCDADACGALSGDGNCDMLCYSDDCDYDGGDCETTDFCHPGCFAADIQDGICDIYCYTQTCIWDGGDCDSDCGDWGCDYNYYGDGHCDPVCATSSCDWDGGDCEKFHCAPGCEGGWVGDKHCDSACWVPACDDDGGDCEFMCSESCNQWDLGDGYCDYGCYVEICNWDDGDCTEYAANYCSFPDCLSLSVGNGVCDDLCYNSLCDYDGGDCDSVFCSSECYNSSVGDGICDLPCNVTDCDFDDGDCDFQYAYIEGVFQDSECQTAVSLSVTLVVECPTGVDSSLECDSTTNEGIVCIDPADFQSQLISWGTGFVQDGLWSNSACAGLPYYAEYYSTGCVMISNNVWGYTEVAHDVLVPWMCTDFECNNCVTLETEIREVEGTCVTNGFISSMTSSAPTLLVGCCAIMMALFVVLM